jgi:hypothetical protein
LVDVPQLGTTTKHASSPHESCISTTSLQKPSNRLGTSPAAVSKEGSSQTDGEDIRQEQSSPATSSSPPSTSGNANIEEKDSLPVRYALHTSLLECRKGVATGIPGSGPVQAGSPAAAVLQVGYLTHDGALMPLPTNLLRVLNTELQEIW